MDVFLITVSIIVVVPLTFKLPIILTLFNVDWPETFNDDNNVDELDTYKLLKFVLLNIVVDVEFKLLIDNVVDVESVDKFVVVAYTDGSIYNSGVIKYWS